MDHAMRWAIRLALFLTALFVLSTGVAGAQEPGDVQVDLPIDVCGIGVGLLGDSSADCAGPAPAEPVTPVEPAPRPPSDDSTEPSADSLVGDVAADVRIPVDVCGIGVGSTTADCGGAATTPQPAPEPPAPSGSGSDPVVPGVLGDVDADLDVPVSVCGIGVGILGDSGADCTGAAPAPSAGDPGDGGASPGDGGGLIGDLLGADLVDDVLGGVVGGLPGGGLVDGVLDDVLDEVVPGTGSAGPVVGDVEADAQMPVSVCGIGVGLLGSSASDCAQVASTTVEPPTTGGPTDPGEQPTGPEQPVLPEGLPVDLPTGELGSGPSGLGTLAGLAGSAGMSGMVDSLTGLPLGATLPLVELVQGALAHTGLGADAISLVVTGLVLLLGGLALRRGATPLA